MRRFQIYFLSIILILSTMTPLIVTAKIDVTSAVSNSDYPPAEWIPSPNTFGSRSASDIQMIVIHTMNTPGASYDAIIHNNTRSQKVSAHYWVGNGVGRVTQMVRDEVIAAHAGHWETNRTSIGIEMHAVSQDGTGLTPALYEATAALVSHLAQKYNIPLDRDHIIGHNEVIGCPNPGGGGLYCSVDPGPYWDWDHFMSLVEGDSHTDWDSEPPSPTGHFPDVDIYHNAFGVIEALYAIGASHGNSDGQFQPDAVPTRGQMAKLLINTLDEYREYEDGNCAFLDVCPGSTFYHYIRRMKELKITNGFSDGTYRPNDLLSRAGIVSFVVRAGGLTTSYSDCQPIFDDVRCDSVHYQNIRRLQKLFDENGMTIGYDDGTFRPDDSATRADTARFVIFGLGKEGFIPKFYDILNDNKFYTYIGSIAERKITDGCNESPPLFCGDELLTRGQVSKFIIRALGEEPYYSDGVRPFPDVQPGDTFYPYIRRLKDLGVVSGFSDGLFRPNQTIMRGEIAKIIVRSLAAVGVACTYTEPLNFSDVQRTDTFYEDIQCLKELRITSGFSDGTFRANRNITRSEAAKFIYLAFIQRTSSVSQEESDIANNARASAPAYSSLIGASDGDGHNHGGPPLFTLPAGDEDWVLFNFDQRSRSSNNVASAVTISMKHLSINAQVQMQVVDRNGILLAETVGSLASSEPEITIPSSQFGADGFYIKLVNQNPFAVEGASGYLIIESQPLQDIQTVCVSSSSGGRVAGLSFRDEDILCHNSINGSWSLLFDGSQNNLPNKVDVDAFQILDGGKILMSFDRAVNIAGLGRVDDSDIVKFIPTQNSGNTSGRFEWYFDGSDVGLTKGGEDIDAITLISENRLLISTLGNATVPRVKKVRDEDLLLFTMTQSGRTTRGTWSRYFDGSDVKLTKKSEDVIGVSFDESTSRINLTTLGSFSVTGIRGAKTDIFSCVPSSTGSNTRCTFDNQLVWDGSEYGFAKENVDGITILSSSTGVRAAGVLMPGLDFESIELGKSSTVAIDAPLTEFVYPDATTTISYTIANLGDVPATYNLELIQDADWNITEIPESITIDAKDEVYVTLDITPSLIADETLTLTAIDQAASDNISVDVSEINVVELDQFVYLPVIQR